MDRISADAPNPNFWVKSLAVCVAEELKILSVRIELARYLDYLSLKKNYP